MTKLMPFSEIRKRTPNVMYSEVRINSLIQALGRVPSSSLGYIESREIVFALLEYVRMTRMYEMDGVQK